MKISELISKLLACYSKMMDLEYPSDERIAEDTKYEKLINKFRNTVPKVYIGDEDGWIDSSNWPFDIIDESNHLALLIEYENGVRDVINQLYILEFMSDNDKIFRFKILKFSKPYVPDVSKA